MQKYLMIYNEIKKEIIDGAIKYKSKLPSKRVMADRFNVSVISVEHAYELLLSEGYIDSKERSGYFAIYTEGEIYQSPVKSVKAKEKIDFKNEGISYSLYAKTTRAVLYEYGEKVLEKSPNSGLYELKIAIKNYLKRNRFIDIDESQIIIGSGAEYLYGLIIEYFGKETVYGIESPSYRQIESVYTAKGVNLERLELKADGISSLSLKNAKAKIIHATPFRSFPTGITASASKKREYLNWAEKNDGYIIEDDYDSEFSSLKIPETIFSQSKNRVIYINTFSKTISRSIRMGYMLLPKSLVKDFTDKLGFYSCTVPSLEQLIITELLNNGAFERHINKIRRERKKSNH